MARRRKHEQTGTATWTTAVTTAKELPPAVGELPALDYLQRIRNAHLNVRTDVARTIGELEAHRDEIDATIAFLRAQRGQ